MHGIHCLEFLDELIKIFQDEGNDKRIAVLQLSILMNLKIF